MVVSRDRVKGTNRSEPAGMYVEFDWTKRPQDIFRCFIIRLEKYETEDTLFFQFHLILFVHWEGLNSHFLRYPNAVIAYFVYVLSQWAVISRTVVKLFRKSYGISIDSVDIFKTLDYNKLNLQLIYICRTTVIWFWFIFQNFCVKGLELFSLFLFRDILELYDWNLKGK